MPCFTEINPPTFNPPETLQKNIKNTKKIKNTKIQNELTKEPKQKDNIKNPTQITRKPPKLKEETWLKYNNELKQLNETDWKKMKRGETTPEQFITDLNGTLASFLESKPEFQKETKRFYLHKQTEDKSIEEMRNLKIKLNKKAKEKGATAQEKAEAKESIRMYSYLLKINKENNELKEKKNQEKSYQQNFFKTAKDVTNGVFGEEESGPTFSKTTADKFYKERYETPVDINTNDLKWFLDVEKPTVDYNLSPYTPKDIRNVLRKKDSNSAPGYDEIVYEYLNKMPFLHQALATSFTRIRDEGIAPDAWGASKIILLKKVKDDENDIPTNFRMISLTLNIGKLFHTLEAERSLQYMISNKYLDPKAQKAYIEGVNGCVEHVVVVQEVIQHARLNNGTANITWFDLQRCFWECTTCTYTTCHVTLPYTKKNNHIYNKPLYKIGWKSIH